MPVAELTVYDEGERYVFRYVQGVEDAFEEEFHAFAAFPDVEATYESRELFAFFQNRIMPRSRPDFPRYVAELGLDPNGGIDVAELLGRGLGIRETDRIETALVPRRDPATGRYVTHFPVRGVRHVDRAEAVAAELTEGESLELLLDPENPRNPRARKLVSERGVVGFLPDFLVAELDSLEQHGSLPSCRVVRLNPPPAPPQKRVLVRLEADWPEGHRPLDAQAFRPFDPRVSDRSS
ncbi:MAG: hypothetical protein AAGA56_20935 [Myxococcota bacterium]